LWIHRKITDPDRETVFNNAHLSLKWTGKSFVKSLETRVQNGSVIWMQKAHKKCFNTD